VPFVECIRNDIKLLFKFLPYCLLIGDVVVLVAGQRTCNLQIMGSISGWASLRSGFGQTNYTRMPLLPSSIIWYGQGKVSAGMVESNSSPPPHL